MGSLPPLECVEAFHLAFLRVLESKLDRDRFVVKGGVNLRAWFASVRYSADLDLDDPGGEAFELRDKVDAALAAPALRGLLGTLGITVEKTTKPKQTETTQRWKLQLATARRGSLLHTKIEFSRRGGSDEHILEPVAPSVVRPYGIPAPTVRHYTAAAALRQKISALAGRREAQARDVWDLDHLLRTTRADPRPLSKEARSALPAALDRAMEMPFEDFRAQVVPYLAPDHQDLYGTPEAWARIQDLVIARLLELAE